MAETIADTPGAAMLRRIVQLACAGRVVPLVGAGVSMTAQSDLDRPDEKWEHHQTSKMKETLASRFRDNPTGFKQLGSLCEMFLQHTTCSSGRHRQLVDLLHIKEFTSLKPTSAHRFIAYLAREGALSEIVTTNYDCCFERAWAQSWGEDDTHRDEIPGLHVTWNLDTYREHAADRGVAPSPGRLPVSLKVHKVNGCADALNKGRLAPRDILLTERQLQRWRERAWARDLFRDRLRTRMVLFTGFGSDEPQVHHTIGLVQEEWSRDGDITGSHKAPPRPLLHEPNPMVVAGFGEGGPSYVQWQALVAYRDAHDPNHRHDPLDLYIGPEDRESFIYVGHLIDKEGKHQLPADLFWHEIYARVAWERLKPYIDSIRAPLVLQLSEVNTIPKLLTDIQRQLVDFNGRTPTEQGRAMWVWGQHQKGRATPVDLPPAISALTALLHPENIHSYVSILEHGDLLVRLLLVCAALDLDIYEVGDPVNHEDGGVRIELDGASSLLVANPGPQDHDDPTGNWQLPPGIQSQLVLLGSSRTHPWRARCGARTQPVFFEDILREFGERIDDLDTLGDTLRHHLVHPTPAGRLRGPTLRRLNLREAR